jgi:hypothetical protein
MKQRGFYVVSPFVGIIFFLIVATVAAIVVNEDGQQLELARASMGRELVFSAQAIEADLFNVLMQIRLQRVLDTFNMSQIVGQRDTLSNRITSAANDSIKGEIFSVYAYAYRNKTSCVLKEAAYSAIYFIPTKYGNKIIDTNFHTEITPLISRYGLVCTSTDPPLAVDIEFKSRSYFLNACNICRQSCGACLPDCEGEKPNIC